MGDCRIKSLETHAVDEYVCEQRVITRHSVVGYRVGVICPTLSINNDLLGRVVEVEEYNRLSFASYRHYLRQCSSLVNGHCIFEGIRIEHRDKGISIHTQAFQRCVTVFLNRVGHEIVGWGSVLCKDGNLPLPIACFAEDSTLRLLIIEVIGDLRVLRAWSQGLVVGQRSRIESLNQGSVGVDCFQRTIAGVLSCEGDAIGSFVAQRVLYLYPCHFFFPNHIHLLGRMLFDYRDLRTARLVSRFIVH